MDTPTRNLKCPLQLGSQVSQLQASIASARSSLEAQLQAAISSLTEELAALEKKGEVKDDGKKEEVRHWIVWIALKAHVDMQMNI